MVEQQAAKKGYWLAFAGAVVGAFLAVIAFLILFLIIGFLAFERLPPGSGFALGGVAIWGQSLAVPIGCSVGIAAALANRSARGSTFNRGVVDTHHGPRHFRRLGSDPDRGHDGLRVTAHHPAVHHPLPCSLGCPVG